MKKQLAEHILNLVKHGHDVVVRDMVGGYTILKGVNPDGTFYGTCFCDTMEECKRGRVGGNYSIQELQDIFTNEYEIVTEPPMLYKKGDLVDILPIAKELPGFERWREKAREMVGQKGLQIKFVYYDGTYTIYTKDKSGCYDFPHWCLAPHFQEESDDKMEEAMELLKKNRFLTHLNNKE